MCKQAITGSKDWKDKEEMLGCYQGWVLHSELENQPMFHWIDLWENLKETMVCTIKYGRVL